MKATVLVADDDPAILEILKLGLHLKGYDVITASDGHDALKTVEQSPPDLVFLDLQMPHIDGIEALRRLRRNWPELPIVIMTAHGTIGLAVEAMKEGAADFITKPFDTEQMLLVIQRALKQEHLRRELEVLREEIGARYDTITSLNPDMHSLIATAKKAATSDATILLLGESGVGKDLLARCIHMWSPRRETIFAPVNCVSLTEELLESELFGHEKGAFTGAHTQKLGKLEVANGGTVFLDEVGDMKPSLQAKLLRFLQNREFDRVGGVRPIKVDVRIIAATNRDLPQAVKAGAFRADLFFRLNVVSLVIPPLRNRPQDIPQLVDRLLSKCCRDMKRPTLKISAPAMNKLTSYSWPGNVRELENAIERAVVLKTGETLEPEDFVFLPVDLQQSNGSGDLRFHASVENHKISIIRNALDRTGGSKMKAAELLGLQPSYLSRLIKQMNI